MDDNINQHQPYHQQQLQQQQQKSKYRPEDSNKQEIKLYSTSKIEDYKQEKIAFVIDMYEEITNEDFVSQSGE